VVRLHLSSTATLQNSRTRSKSINRVMRCKELDNSRKAQIKSKESYLRHLIVGITTLEHLTQEPSEFFMDKKCQVFLSLKINPIKRFVSTNRVFGNSQLEFGLIKSRLRLESYKMQSFSLPSACSAKSEFLRLMMAYSTSLMMELRSKLSLTAIL
jgi:hypothetical protein